MFITCNGSSGAVPASDSRSRPSRKGYIPYNAYHAARNGNRAGNTLRIPIPVSGARLSRFSVSCGGESVALEFSVRRSLNRRPANHGRTLRVVAVLAAVLAGSTGCRLTHTPVAWHPPRSPQPARTAHRVPFDPNRDLSTEAAYAKAVRLDKEDSPECLAWYLEAARRSGECWQSAAAEGIETAEAARARAIWRASVAKLVTTSARLGLLDPARGVRIPTPQGETVLPIEYHAFAWGPEDFNQWLPVGDYEAEGLSRRIAYPGVGVPFVIVRRRPCEETFFGDGLPFAATVVLESRSAGGTRHDALACYNPLVCSHVTLCRLPAPVPLESDLSAPYVRLLDRERPFLTGFLTPGATEDAPKLTMLEPYQPGKIPVVLLHGLLSDPLTWVDMVNELRSDPTLSSGYQFWTFRYPTGQSFLRSAADLRRLLAEAVETADPCGADPALRDMVLIGHSMGGLVAKLQVVDSQNHLWNAAARVRFEQIRGSEEHRRKLAEIAFFRPSPFITRVVFIGTPHGGSMLASRLVGRIAAGLVEGGSIAKEHASVVRDNPGAFDPRYENRMPTSIDILEPDDPLLNAIRLLRPPGYVRMHSIVGCRGNGLCKEPGDGVVSLASARIGGVVSESTIPADHEELHHHPETIAALRKILLNHLSESDERTCP